MRYEIRLIGAELENGIRVLHPVLHQSDSERAAKRYAEKHNWDAENGTAVVDNETETVDTGNAVLPLSRFTLRP